jgi:O-antigen ligase
MFLARPLVGVGPDNYRLLYGRYSTIKEADPRVHSNSMYFEVLAGAGLIGAAALLGLGLALGRAIMACAEGPPPAPAIAAACAAIAVHGLADSFLSFTGTYILIAVALGLASACARDGGLRAHRV